jgi:hypothetical protein
MESFSREQASTHTIGGSVFKKFSLNVGVFDTRDAGNVASQGSG